MITAFLALMLTVGLFVSMFPSERKLFMGVVDPGGMVGV
jgi:hypothetical protein